jgi:hypothetical protein
MAFGSLGRGQAVAGRLDFQRIDSADDVEVVDELIGVFQRR